MPPSKSTRKHILHEKIARMVNAKYSGGKAEGIRGNSRGEAIGVCVFRRTIHLGALW